jgi:DNA-binding CsgD family transcriptional regulator
MRWIASPGSAVVALVAIRRSSYPFSTVVRLSHRELRSALEFVHDASSTCGAEPFPRPVVESLARLVPGESVSYYEWSLRWPFSQTVAVEMPTLSTPAEVAEATRHLCATYPLSNLRLRTATQSCRLSDFISLRALHRLDYYDHVLRAFGIEHQMRVWLPAPRGAARVFYFSRRSTDGDFDDRERGVLDLLRPFLVALRERFDLRKAAAPVSNGLTEREAEILGWVARGKTNHEIAEVLVVSPHTVRKHLENVYAKLGVHTRTAAVARAFAYLN